MSDIFGLGWLSTVLQAQEAAMLAAVQSTLSSVAKAEAARDQAALEAACQQRMFEHLTARQPKAPT